MSQNKQVNLFIALGKFIEKMREFISTEMKRKYGDSWDRKYFEKLIPHLQEAWGNNLQQGISPEYLVDFGNLNSFAIGAKKDFFYAYFGKKSNNLPTIFNELAEVRNITAHYLPLDTDKAEKAYLHMIELAKNLEMGELEKSLRKLKSDSFGSGLSMTPEVVSKSKKYRSTQSQIKTIKKSEAIGIINDAINDNTLSGGNTVFSNIIKTAPVWWLNIPPSKFETSLNILLADKEELIWINLPEKTCYPPENIFNTRKDNGKVDLKIGIQGNEYLRDLLNEKHFDFKPFVRKTFKI